MNFNDLCFIYAHTTADGRYSLSSHDIDFDDDIQGVNMGVFISCHGSAEMMHLSLSLECMLLFFFLKLNLFCIVNDFIFLSSSLIILLLLFLFQRVRIKQERANPPPPLFSYEYF